MSELAVIQDKNLAHLMASTSNDTCAEAREARALALDARAEALETAVEQSYRERNM